MVFLRTGVVASLAALSLLGSTLAAPLADRLRSLSAGARDLLKRSSPAAPRFVTYGDAWVSPLPTPTELQVSTFTRISLPWSLVDATLL